ncbi:MAG TPA: DNA alkylation repair protein [Polyangiaceae bacterium]|nr:DNA alkylation repair protein [Polyangiaceae bacterium]
MPRVSLLHELRGDLVRAANPDQALKMQRYMKSLLPYYGVPMPLVRAICKEKFEKLTFTDADAWQKAVLALWQGARFREELYAALGVCGLRAARPFQTIDALPLYERLIVEGAWWDVVDEIASNRLGEVLRASPAPMKKAMRRWSRDDNLWKRRSAIICQLKAKQNTDLELLFDCIAPSLGSKEFFLQKAIGWALRQHAKADPKAVKRYVKENEAKLGALSKREALKHL